MIWKTISIIALLFWSVGTGIALVEADHPLLILGLVGTTGWAIFGIKDTDG